jgi:hypothetical protein
MILISRNTCKMMRLSSNGNRNPGISIVQFNPSLYTAGKQFWYYCAAPHCKPYHGIIEVKCPYSLRDLHPLEAAKHSNFFCGLDCHGSLKLKRSHAYYFRVQGQLAISKRSWCHFIVWQILKL